MSACSRQSEFDDAPKDFIDSNLVPAVEKYRQDMGSYPGQENGILCLIENVFSEPQWKGPYVVEIPLDPWARKFQYRYPGIKNPDSYDLWSLGSDGVESSDDIGNWGKAERVSP